MKLAHSPCLAIYKVRLNLYTAVGLREICSEHGLSFGELLIGLRKRWPVQEEGRGGGGVGVCY